MSVPDYDKDRNEKFTNILRVRGSMGASLKLVNLQRILNSSKLVILQRINVVKVFFQYFYNIY